MIKSVIFAQRKKNMFDRVYSPDIMKHLESFSNIFKEHIDKDNLIQNCGMVNEAEVAFSTWGMPSFTQDEIKTYMPKLKVLFYAAGSIQSFGRPFLKNGVKVVSAWEANAVPVAEYAVAQILLANKGFYQALTLTKQSYLESRKYIDNFPGNYSVKVGILGAGKVGGKVIELLKPYNIDILVFDPYLSEERAKELGVVKCSLEEIFLQCQTISNHLANLPQIVGILNGNLFSHMLPYATFINTGRGAQVVESDLIEALKKVPTRTAVLDVTWPEPPSNDSELISMKNIFLTPHIAGSLGNEVVRMGWYMVEEFERYKAGKDFKYSVTLEMLDTMA